MQHFLEDSVYITVYAAFIGAALNRGRHLKEEIRYIERPYFNLYYETLSDIAQYLINAAAISLLKIRPKPL